MKKIFINTLYITTAFIVLCALSYHNDTDVDGNLSFGFPFEIYNKAVRVISIDTHEIGESSSFNVSNLIADIIFATIITVLLFYFRNWLKRKNSLLLL